MRDLINIVEALSKRSTVAPDWMLQRERTPVGEVLFHGTPICNTLNILKTNRIETGTDWRGEGDRVALTRSYKVAFESFGFQGDFDMYPSVLVLNWSLLAKRFHVIPHNDVDCNGDHWKNPHSDDGTEQEEAVYGNIGPLNQFLVSVNVPPKLLKKAMEDRDYHEWIVEERGYAKSVRGVQAMFQALANHPKLNVWKP